MEAAKAYAILENMMGRLDTDLVRAFRPVAHIHLGSDGSDGSEGQRVT